MRPVLLLLSFTLIIVGCKDSGKVPGTVLPMPRMQAVMWDIMRADQFLSDYVLNKDSSKNKDRESMQLYSRIFTFHKISKEEFEKSFAYYRSNPLQLQVLMDSMSKRKLAIPGADTSKQLAPVSDTITADTMKKIIPPRVNPRIRRDSASHPVIKVRE